MNSFTETLNGWGGHCLSLAWPMLWQSSLLIAAVFVLEFAFRRKIRAAIRYALWLAVLVKLLLPPSLALPTSAAWWLRTSPQPVAKTPTISYSMSYGEQTGPAFPLQLQSVPPLARPKISLAGWSLIVSAAASVGLLAWLVIRWQQIRQKVRQAKNSDEFSPHLNAVRRLTRLHPDIRLKLTEDSMSPAVCGLFRPVILLPQSLVEKLSAGQLRAVLLHEAIHLRRGDVWVNCAQALLQIVYWWHPLLWLANARIRRVREEAVDDAVMLALRDDAEIYAPTLLEVAKLAFNRPLASLGLVGILESRSALRQRIERLINFNAPRKAGLTIVSILGILAFSAVALPMGQAPEKTNAPTASTFNLTIATNALENASTINSNSVRGILSDTNFQARVHALEQRTGVETLAEPKAVTTAGRQVQLMSANYVLQQVQYTSVTGRDFSTSTNAGEKKLKAGILAQDGKSLYEIGKFDDAEAKLKAAISLNPDNQAAHYYLNLVERSFKAKATSDSTINLDNSRTNSGVPTGKITVHHIHPGFLIKGKQEIYTTLDNIRLDSIGYDGARLADVQNNLSDEITKRDPRGRILPFLMDVSTMPGKKIAVGSVTITIKPPLMNASGLAVLDAIVKGADQPIKYSIEDNDVAFSWSEQTNPPLEMRVFKVDPHTFAFGLQSIRGFQTNSVATSETNLHSLSSRLGIDLDLDLTAPGRSIAYNDRLGLLFVKATSSEMDTVERVIVALNQLPPQIHIKARFIEVPEGEVEAVLKTGTAADTKEKNTVEIITAEKMKLLLRQLESDGKTTTLAEPEAETTSGRQVQMRSDNSTIDLQPWLLSDGYTLNLTTIVSAPEKFTALANIWDGQTLALVSSNAGGTNRLVVFITATVIDRAGNPVHTADELPFDPSTIPVQPKILIPSR